MLLKTQTFIFFLNQLKQNSDTFHVDGRNYESWETDREAPVNHLLNTCMGIFSAVELDSLSIWFQLLPALEITQDANLKPYTPSETPTPTHTQPYTEQIATPCN